MSAALNPMPPGNKLVVAVGLEAPGLTVLTAVALVVRVSFPPLPGRVFFMQAAVVVEALLMEVLHSDLGLLEGVMADSKAAQL